MVNASMIENCLRVWYMLFTTSNEYNSRSMATVCSCDPRFQMYFDAADAADAPQTADV